MSLKTENFGQFAVHVFCRAAPAAVTVDEDAVAADEDFGGQGVDAIAFADVVAAVISSFGLGPKAAQDVVECADVVLLHSLAPFGRGKVVVGDAHNL